MTAENLARSLLHEYKQEVGECLTGLQKIKMGGKSASYSESLLKRLSVAVRRIARLKREYPLIHGPRAKQMRLPI